MNAKRKTISPQDVLEAMKEMEFERFVDKLKQCLEGKHIASQIHSNVIYLCVNSVMYLVRA